MATGMDEISGALTERVRRPRDDYGSIADSPFQKSGGGFQAARTKGQMGGMGERSMGAFGGLRERMMGSRPEPPGRRMGSVRSRFGAPGLERDGGRDSGTAQDRELADRTEILRRNPLAIGSTNPFARMLRGGRDSPGSASSPMPAPMPAPAPAQDPSNPYSIYGPIAGGPSLPASTAPGPTTQPINRNPVQNPNPNPLSIYGPTAGGPMLPASPIGPTTQPIGMGGRVEDLASRIPRRQGVYNPYGAGGAFA